MPRVLVAVAIAVAVLVAAPAAQARVPQGFFGVMWDRAATNAPEAQQGEQWTLMAQSGVESVRTVFRWWQAQPTGPASVNFSTTDRIVERAARRNIRLLPQVQGTPDWAALVPGQTGSPPKRPSDFTAYLRALVARYGPAGSFWDERPDLPRRPLRHWQIWNEPHLDFHWNTRGRSPNAWAREYARLLKASKRAIEVVDPGAVIVLAGMADFAWKHLDRLNRHRIALHFDVAAINFFTARPRNTMKGLRLFRRAMARGGERRKPLWLTETTWPAGDGRAPRPNVAWQRAWSTTDAGMAKRVRQVYALAVRNRRKLKLGRVYWYTWSSSYSDTDLFDYGGLVRYAGGVFEPRPALGAYRATARRYRG